jgi:acetyl esterase/lipase
MKKQSKHHKSRKTVLKIILWIIGVIVTLILLMALAFRLSPWPGALLIRYEFEKNDVKILQALQKHTSTTPITTLSNQTYRQNDADALADVYYPTGTTKKLPVIIWTHGGAWISGEKTNASPYFKLLSAAGFTVIVPRYSLAPEHTYPTPVHQLNALYGYIQQNAERFYADTTNIILAGDSAGSQLSSQMAALITNPDYARMLNITPTLQPSQLKGVMLNCGIYKMHELTVPDPTLPKILGWGTDVSVWAYAGTRDFSDPILKQMSPYYHVTANFPRTYISGGNADPLTKVQSKPFAELLQSQGTEVTTLFFPENYQPALPHEYQFNLDNDAGNKALEEMISFAKSAIQ